MQVRGAVGGGEVNGVPFPACDGTDVAATCEVPLPDNVAPSRVELTVVPGHGALREFIVRLGTATLRDIHTADYADLGVPGCRFWSQNSSPFI